MKTLIYLCLVGTILFSGCAGADNSATSANNNSAAANINANFRPEPPKNPQTPFENALFSVRVGDFEQVLVFRRRDGGAFTDEDKNVLRSNSPAEQGREVNRWTKCEDEKCFVAGTNFKFTRANLLALQNRFDVKDYSTGDGVDVILPEDAPAPKNENTKK